MKISSSVLLSVAIFLTLWMIHADLDVPNHSSRWGEIPMGVTMVLIFVRWIVLSAGFVLLLWANASSFWKTFLALAGIFALEVAVFNLHRTGLTPNVQPHFKTIFLALATILPLCVIVGGFLSSRLVCMAGVIVAVGASIVGNSGEKTFLRRPYFDFNRETPIAFMLLSANPMSEAPQLAELWGKIESRSDWAEQVAAQLDGENRMYALYALCHSPGRLTESLQERCWTVAGQAARAMKKQHEHEPFVTATVLQLFESVKALAAVPGDLRDRHRADFQDALGVMKMAHDAAPFIPVLDDADWTTPAK